MNESPIFTRTHDMIVWIMQITRRFPREQRFVLARRLQETAFTLEDALIAASRDKANSSRHLLRADIALTSLRKTFLVCVQIGLLDNGQYQHASQFTAEVGRLLGGWMKSDAR